ncbi:hypothetical protein [Spiroplasma endosymbiont of Polydrusus cervinus]|uniref:hypothetical protein n=1 Tax=Spiroplasma endosymbiont of Polydrusus cervinus TaxID=3066287 RepID=UPI0030D19184
MSEIINVNEKNEYVIQDITIDKNNNVYFLIPLDGIYIIKENETKANKIKGIEIDGYSVSISFDNFGNVYFGSTDVAYKLINNNSIPIKINGIKGNINSIFFDKNYTYFSTITKGFYKLKHSTYISEEIKETTDVESFIFDNFGNIYFGKYNGLFFLKNGETSLILKKIYKIKLNNKENNFFIDENNNSYIISNDNIYILNNEEKELTRLSVDFNINNIYSINKNKDNIYFSADNGFYFLKINKNKPILKKVYGIEIKQNQQIKSLIFDNNDNIYVAYNDSFYFLKNGETQATKISEINNYVSEIKIDKNNNVYFVSDNYLYKIKNNETQATKISEINNENSSILIDNEDNIYFKKNDNFYIFKYDGNTMPIKIKGINNSFNKILFDNENNIYFITNNGFFKLKTGETQAIKINGIEINNFLGKLYFDSKKNLYVESFSKIYFLNKNSTFANKVEGINKNSSINIIDKGNNVYFRSNNDFYKLEYGKIIANKINGLPNDTDIILSEIDKNDNVIFKRNVCGAHGFGLWILKKENTTVDEIIGIKDYVNSVYFFENDIYINVRRSGAYILKQNETEAKLLNNINGWVHEIIKDSKGNIYFYANYGFYFLKNGENNPIKIDGLYESINKIIVDKNDNLYILTYDGEIYILRNEIIKITEINLDVNQKINSTIFNKNQGIINFNLLLKLAFFLNYTNNFLFFNLKEIKDIDINDLDFDNVEVTRGRDLNWSADFKSVCFTTKEHRNNSSIKKTVYTPKCEYNQKSKFMFHIIKGINKNGKDNVKIDCTQKSK